MNLRKLILYCIPIIVLLLAASLGLKIWTTLKQKNSITASTQQLPSIQLRIIDGGILTTDIFRNSKNVLVLNYFNPDCDHCQKMVKELFQEKALLVNVHWLMITSATVERTKRFVDSMQINRLNNVTVLNDTARSFHKTFGITSVPSFYVYKNGQLLRKHSGECSIAYLIKE